MHGKAYNDNEDNSIQAHLVVQAKPYYANFSRKLLLLVLAEPKKTS